MSYDFSVDKKTGIILVSGYALVGALLFVAGFLLGINYGLSSRAAEIVAGFSPAKIAPARSRSASAKSAEQRLETSLMPGSLAPPARTPSVSPPPLAPQSPVGGAANAITATEPAAPVSTAQSISQKAVQPLTIPPTAGPPAALPPPVSPAKPGTAAAATTAASSPPASHHGYSIQVGAFLDPRNAAQLAKDLQQQGYKATVLDFSDSEYRVWHAVRFGQFKDMAAAAREARTFERNEQLLAIVRHANSL